MNKPNPTPNQSFKRVSRAEQFVRTWTTLKSVFTALALVAGAMFVPAAQAQTLTFQSTMQRVTVPAGYVGILVLSNNMAYTTNGMTPDGDGNMIIQPITVSLAGLPAGASVDYTNMSTLTNITPFTATELRTNSNNTVRLWVNFHLDGSTPEGSYALTLTSAGGATNFMVYFLDVAHLWNGSTNTITDGVSKWSTSSNWLGGGVPGTSANVIFTDLGGQTNFGSISGTSTNWQLSSIVDSDVEIGSLRFSDTNASTAYHTIQINPGFTLKITGTNGFSMLRDYPGEFGPNTRMIVTFLGTNATLLVSNTSANFAMFNDSLSQHLSILNLMGLDTFKADVNRFGLGNALLYPDFFNMDDNNYGNHGNTSVPRRMLPDVWMAKTNIIKTSYVGPDNYTNDTTRECAVNFSKNAYGSTSTSQSIWFLGLSNIFYTDSISFNAYGSGAAGVYCQFAPTNNPIAIFRGMSGGNSRVSFMSIADGAGVQTAVSSTKGGVNFGVNNGTVDAMVDRLIIASDHPKIAAGTSSQPNYQGFLVVGSGTFDVNTAILGYQNSGTKTNTDKTDLRGYCQGSLLVSNTASVFKINKTLTLGWTTDTAVQSSPFQNRGQVFINGGGTLMVNTVLVGGPTRGSANNTITIAGTNNNVISSLIVSNTIADTNVVDNITNIPLSALSFGGNANLTLFVDGTRTSPYICTTNLNTAGQNNTITIGALKNVTYVGGTVQLPLISYQAGNPVLLGVRMPAGFVGSGTILQNGAGEWDLYISTNAPNTNLLWRPIPGIGTTNWDSTSLVWSNQDNHMMTNFHSGDWVAFDDAPNLASNINQTIAILLPGKITMTNRNVKYTITGVGLQGGAVLTKFGTNTLDVEGSALIAMALAEGIMTNGTGGTIGGVAVSTGATMINNGQINGGAVCAGTVVNSGTMIGSLGIMSGGVVTNSNGANINGVPSFQDGAFLYNSGTITYPLGVTCTVSSNATFINNNIINGDNLVVSGTLEDTGAGNISLYNTLTINGPPTTGSLTNPVGGLFIPGGDGVGSTKILPVVGISSFPGRVSMLSGARVILKVTNNLNTVLYSPYQDFGPSAGTPTYNGCILVITNVGSIPFSDGQVFTMFQYIDTENVGGPFLYDGTATNTYPTVQPAGAGTGLAWDLKYLTHRYDTGVGHDNNNGKIGVIGTAVNPTNVLMAIVPQNGYVVTNITTTSTNITTNNVIFTTLTWPTNHVGWRLQSQNNSAKIGLSNNWVTVFQTPYTNYIYITNNLVTNSAWFYRMVYP